LQQLLCNPEDPRPGIISQLQGVATWLVSQDSHFRSDLLQLDSWMLLTSDALTLDAGLQEPLVRALLESARKDPATLHESEARTHYRKLAHPRLGPQLRAYLREPGAPVPVRGLALRIALACEERSLAPEYLDLALEATAPLPLRIQALDALRELGDGTPDARLLPLAKLGVDMDPKGELRDRVLSWLWPGVLPTAQLFEALRDPGEDAPMQRTEEALLERLPPQELPSALRWVREYLSQPKPLRLAGLADELLGMAFDFLDEPGVFDPYCAALWPKLKRALRVNPSLLLLEEGRELPSDWWNRLTDEERWRVIDGLAALRESPDELRLLAKVKPPLLFKWDFQAVLLRARQATSPEEQAHWAYLLSCCYPEDSSEPLEAIFQAIEQDARLESAFSWLLNARSLEERPQTMRVRYMALDANGDMSAYGLSLTQHYQEPPASIQEKCEQLLQRIESANPLDWLRLVDVLRSSPDRRPELLGTWRWRGLPKAIQDRIVRAAPHVLSQLQTREEPWLEGEIPGWAVCIYEAFNLLAACEPGALDTLPEPTWGNWASLLLASPASASDPRKELRRALVERASRHAPVDVMRTFRRILGRAGEDSSHHTRASAFLLSLTGCWNETLHQVAIEALRNPATPPSLVVRLFEILLLQQVPEVQAIAESVMRDPGGSSREQKVNATRVLFTHGPIALAPELWDFLQADEDFAREVFEGCNDHAYTFAGRHEPGLLADIYLWIEHHGRAPHSPDKALGWRMRIQLRSLHQLQQQIRDRLPERMTRSSEAALERLCREIPGDEVLQQKLYFARLFTRSRTWTPPSPRELLELVGLQRKRLVRNGRELLEILLESLRRLEEKLHGVTSAVHFLWDEEHGGRWSPKRELPLSDWVKLHLDEDLAGRRIAVNREVEVRPTLPSRTGERVDLWVDAIAGQDRISVLIEVKIADHGELWTAMRDQLVRRYLSENHLRYGIYLVGWYACAQWNKTTPHPVERRPSLARAKELLEEQARSLSQGGVEVRAFILDAAFRPEHG
ncbi:MAG TPA: hypothetical protein VEY88_18200, partial [Archangium sp.]|nr:hypothetical protein [Archangium sp.]